MVMPSTAAVNGPTKALDTVGGERQRGIPVGQLEHTGHPERLRQPQPDRQIQKGIERDFGDAQRFVHAFEEGRDDIARRCRTATTAAVSMA